MDEEKVMKMDEEKIDIKFIRMKDMEKIINKDVDNGRKSKIGIKTGIIKKCSFKPTPHMIVSIVDGSGEGDIWLEGPIESFEKGDYTEGTLIAIKGKDIGTIAGECDFGKIEPLPLYVADYVRIIHINRNDVKNEVKREVKIGIIKKSAFDEDGIHAIVKIGDEDTFVEGHGYFEKGDYVEGTRIEMDGKDIGTIVGEWEFGDLGILPLFEAEKIRIIK